MKAILAVIIAAVCFLMVGAPEHRQGEGRRPVRGIEAEEHSSGAMEALNFWSRSRAYPGVEIPSDKYSRAYQSVVSRLKDDPRSAQAISPWRSIGPVNIFGRMLSVAVNPRNPNTVYAGSASGGLWRTNKGGLDAEWHRVTLGYPVLGVSAIAIDSADTNIIYIGTGEVYRYHGTEGGVATRTTRGSYGMGILKTTDGGLTWIKSLDWSYNQERGIEAIKIDPLNSSTVLAATTEGIYRSFEAGKPGSWEQVCSTPMAEDIVFNRNDTTFVMASFGDLGSPGAGMYFSADGGSIFFTLGDLPVLTGKTLLEPWAGDPDVVYASIADSTNYQGGVYRTTDFGMSWSVIDTAYAGGTIGVQGWYSHFVAVHPHDQKRIVHAGVTMTATTDGGGYWFPDQMVHADHHAYAHDPQNADALYEANDAGIAYSPDFGVSWNDISYGLLTTQFYNGFSCSATDSVIALGQIQDNIPGALYRGSPYWALSAADEVGWTGIDPSNDSLMYAAGREGSSIVRSTDRGNSFTYGYAFDSYGSWNSPFVIAPSSPNILYFGKNVIFKSTDHGVSWSTTAGGASPDANPALSMAISSNSPDTVYVGTAPVYERSHIFRTVNGGTTWVNVTGGLPDRYPMDLAVDPRNARNVYLAFGGYGTGHLFKSTDAGGSWSDISGPMPDVHATAVVIDPRNSGIVYVGTDLGVFVSTDAGGSWTSYSNGLPEAVLVSDLVISPASRMLRAATHGNGVYERPLLPPGLLATSVSLNAGWNLVSLPYEVANDSVSALYPSVSSRTAFGYSNGYTIEGEMTPGQGYWVKVPAAVNQPLAGSSLPSLTIPLNPGWNLIGSVDHQVAAPSGGIIAAPVFGYDNGYKTVSILTPGQGYWVKASSGGTITLGPAAQPGTERLPDLAAGGALVFTDAKGSSQTLHISSDASVKQWLDRFELPPAPPEGCFDVRFADGRSLAVAEGNGEHAVILHAGLFPVRVDWHAIPGPTTMSLSVGGTLHSLEGNGTLPIAATADGAAPPICLTLTTSDNPQTPREFSLAQNYPNPFNAETRIRYSLPSDDVIRLAVYDLLGREVRVLAQGLTRAGEHVARFDGSNLPSGLYIYRIESAEFKASAKMLLLR